jgi:hypothetical protein
VEGETRGPGIAPFNFFDPIGFPIGAWFPSLGVLFAHFFVQQHNQLNIEVRSRGSDLGSVAHSTSFSCFSEAGRFRLLWKNIEQYTSALFDQNIPNISLAIRFLRQSVGLLTTVLVFRFFR